jgi:Dolichyl-phosphate-mannose-protein mannosyltransferase
MARRLASQARAGLRRIWIRIDEKSETAAFVLAALFFAAAFVFLAWPWLSGTVTIPWDAKAQFQPNLRFLASSLARGESPFWTPHVFAGWPQIADPQSLIFSPLHLVLAALDPNPSFRAVDAVAFAYLFAGGIGVLLFYRDHGWHPAGAAIAALIFAFGGSASSRLQHTSEIISLSYAPLALWLLARALNRGSWRYGLAAGAVIALIIIGRDQVALLALYMLALYVVFWSLDGGKRLARIRRAMLPLAVCAVTAAVIAAVPVALSVLLAAESNRPVVGLEAAGRGSLHPVLLLMLVVSDLFGAADPNVVFWGPPSPGWREKMTPTGLFLAQNMGEIYCGILGMILLFGAGLARGLLWTREIRFFTVMLALVLLYALGWYTPAFRLMYELPGVDLFRRPADATFVIGLLVAITTGYLVHRLLVPDSGEMPLLRTPPWWAAIDAAWIAIPITIAIAVALEAGKLDVALLPVEIAVAFAAGGVSLVALVRRILPARPVLAAVLLCSFTVFDLAWNNAPNESTGLPPALYEALKPDGNDETIALLKSKLAETARPDRRDRVELIGIAYHWPGVGLAQGFDHLFGHNPLRLRDFARATGVGDTVATAQQRAFAPLFPSYRSVMADLCGVRFIATGVPAEQVDRSLKPGDLNFIARTKDAYVYENPRALPRVMVVPDGRIADFEALLRTGWPPDIDPRRTVLLEEPALLPPRSGDAKPVAGTARILRYGSTEIDIEAEAPDGGFLVLNDAWHPWWRAKVDGQPARILKANVLFRAVPVSPGVHRVHFVFAPLQGAWEQVREKLAGAP